MFSGRKEPAVVRVPDCCLLKRRKWTAFPASHHRTQSTEQSRTDPHAGLVSRLVEVLREVVESVQQLEPAEGGVPGHGPALRVFVQSFVQLAADPVSPRTRRGASVEWRWTGLLCRAAVRRHTEGLRVGGEDASFPDLSDLFRQLGHAQRLPAFAPGGAAFVGVQRMSEAVRFHFIPEQRRRRFAEGVVR